MLSAKELSMGITKLSGSKPLLWVDMATANERTTIKEAARMFVVRSCTVNLDRSIDPCMDDAMMA